MFAEERRNEIVKILKHDGRVSAKDISEQFNVSIDTVRRDLSILECKGILKRTHGGALNPTKVRMLPKKDSISDMDENIKPNVSSVAKLAASLIEEGDTVFIGGTSTHYAMLAYLPVNIRFTVVTSSIIIADEIRNRENIETFMACGKVRPNGNLVDPLAAEFVRTLRIDTAFMVSGGLSAAHGLSNATSEAVVFHRAVASVSNKIICLSPSCKLGSENFIREIPPEQLDIVITDWEAPEEEIAKLREKGIKVIRAEKDY